MSTEKVDHPDHYRTGNLECIEVMVQVFGADTTADFCRLNAFKYLWRSDLKGGVEDIKKAAWYLRKYLELKGEA